jgi:hypothetical protein
MDIGRMHEMLEEISHAFSVDVLARGDTSAKIAEALRRHGKLAQRHSPLRPTFVAWLVLAMTLFREKSIPNVMVQLVAAVRGKRPAIPLGPVTDSAISQARARMGPEPMRTLFRSLAEEVRPQDSFHGLRVWSVVQSAPDRRLPFLRRRLLADIADCRPDRPRRPRVYDRVVKQRP